MTAFYCHPGLTSGANNGTSWADAWRSFASINWATLNSATTGGSAYVYVKKGTLSRVKISPSMGGTTEYKRLFITTDPLDSGATPIIRVSNEISGDWTTLGGGIYSISLPGWTRNSGQCWQDLTTPLAKGSNTNPLAGQFWLDITASPYVLYVHCSDGNHPETHTIELSTDAQSAYFGGTANHITLQNVALQHGDTPPYATARFYTCNDVIVEHAVLGPASGGAELRGTNIKIRKSEIRYIWNGKNYNFGGSGSGISVNGGGGGGHEIELNTIHHCYVGFGFTTPATGLVSVRRNVFFDNYINCLSGGGTAAFPLLVLNNTIYHAPDGTAGYNNGHALDVQTVTDDAGLIAKNNLIVVDSDYDSQCVLISKNSYAYIDIDNNHYYRIGSGGHVGNLSGVNYTSMAEWQTALGLVPAYVGKDANSQYGDPMFLDSLIRDLRLGSLSPCRAAGVDVGLLYGWPSVDFPDIGALEYYPTTPGALTAESELFPPAIAAQQEIPYAA